MLSKINPGSTTAWQQLKGHFAEMRSVKIKTLFAEDAERFNKYNLQLDDILFDYSKNIVTEKTIQLLLQLATECELPTAISSMFNGDMINETEKRSVLHIALRNFSKNPIFSEGKDVMPEVKKVLRKM